MSFHIFDKKKRATCCSSANFRLKSKCKSCTNQVVPLRLQFVDNVEGIADSKLSFYASRRVKRILSQTRCKLVILFHILPKNTAVFAFKMGVMALKIALKL